MNLESLNRKVYGVPVWVWAVGSALVLLLLFRHFRKGAASGGTASVSPFPVRVAQGETQVPQEGQG